MNLFPEDTIAEIEIKKEIIAMLEEKKKKLDAKTQFITVELMSLRDDIERLQKKMEKDEN